MIKDDDMDKGYFLDISKRVSNQVDHMSETLDEFRGFFRPKAEYNKVSLKKVIDSALILMKDEIIKHTIMIKFIGDDSLKVNVISTKKCLCIHAVDPNQYFLTMKILVVFCIVQCGHKKVI